MKIILYIFLMVVSVFSKPTKLSLIIVTSPKKRPELTRSIKDMINVLKHCPNDLIVNEIIFAKGCIFGCEHSEMDNAIKTIKNHFPNIKVTSPDFKTEENGLYMSKEWSKDFYESLRQDVSHYDFTYENYIKYMIVNFYFIQCAKYIYDNKERTQTDYALFLEDDLIYQENAFDVILNLIKNNNEEELIYSKMASNQPSTYFSGMKKLIAKCSKFGFGGGYYGVLRSMNQLRKYILQMKFSGHTECGDTLSENWCISADKSISLFEAARHFGRDNSIPN